MTLFDPRQHMVRLVFILGAITALTPLAIDMYIPAFPQIAADFGVPVARVELSLTFFLIGLAIGQLFYGTISDKYGRKKPLYAGMLLAIGATITCAFIKDPNLFLFCRFVQAIGICGGAVIARAMVRDLFNHHESARFFSFLILVMGVAPILAPLLGGYVAEYMGWHAIFLFIGGFTTLLLITVAAALPETNKGNPEVRISRSFQAYREVLRDPSFLRMALSGAFVMAGMFAYVTGSPFVFIQYYGIPADKFGWVFGLNALGFIVMSQVNRTLITRFKFESILKTGFLIVGFACLLLILAGLANAPMIGFGAAIFLYVATMGVVLPNSAAMAMAEQASRAGSASAMLGSLQFGIAFVASGAIGLAHAQTQLPLAIVVGSFGLAGAAIYLWPVLRRPVQPAIISE